MKYSFITLGLLFVSTSCEKIDLDKIDNLNNGKIDVIGHGGAGFQSLINPLPSNSFTSIKKAIDGLNADGVEVDLKVSNDSIPVLYHDDVLEKSTNCAGCPEKYSSQDLLNCKFKNYYGSRAFNEENLISFQQMVDHFKNRTKLPHIFASTKTPTVCTIDDPSQLDKYAKVIASIIEANNAAGWISVYDGDVNLLNRVRLYNPDIDLIYNAQDFNVGLNVCLTNNYSGMVIKTNDITKEQVKQAHNNNIKVILWGVVYKKEMIDAIEKYPDALMTDNIELTQEILRN